MIYDILYDLSCVAFLVLSAVICFKFVGVTWGGTTHFCMGWDFWRRRALELAAVVIGIVHLLFAVMKLAYLIAWTVTT